MLLPDFLLRGSAKPSPGEKVPNAVRRMRNSDGSQIRKQYHETRKVPILPKLPTDLQAFAIPHPALRATFPPGEGIGATAPVHHTERFSTLTIALFVRCVLIQAKI